jgi:hypothetical protein
VLALAALRRRAWRALRAKLDEQTADSFLAAKLRSVFEDRFRYDEAGTPRVWSPTDDIDGLYRAARDEVSNVGTRGVAAAVLIFFVCQTLALVPLYARIEPTNASLLPSIPSHAALVERGEEEEFDFDASLLLFGEARKADVAARLRKEADAYYVEAKRSTVSSIAQVPVWMYAVLAALGWNEAMAVLRSPLYFAFVLILLASAYGECCSTPCLQRQHTHRSCSVLSRVPPQPLRPPRASLEGRRPRSASPRRRRAARALPAATASARHAARRLGAGAFACCCTGEGGGARADGGAAARGD